MEITQEFLDDLAIKLNPDHIVYLQDQVSGQNIAELEKRIRAQLETAEEIFDMMSLNQYYEQEIEVLPKMKVKFRTLTPSADDDALSFAWQGTKTEVDYQRRLNRRRLAYGLREINSTRLSIDKVDGSYFEFMLVDPEFTNKLKEIADEAYSKINIMPTMQVEQLSIAFGVWEKAVYESVRGENAFELAKN